MPARIHDPMAHVLSRLNRAGDCWEWAGSRHPHGYGQVRISGRLTFVHRFMYEGHVGPIAQGLVVRHRCDNPPCCNPAHLDVGTPADNVRDAVERGRRGRPRRPSHCKRGHAFDAGNTRHNPDGSRTCRECSNARRRIATGTPHRYVPRRKAA